MGVDRDRSMYINLDHSLLVHKNVGAGHVAMDQVLRFEEVDPIENLRS